MSDNPIADAQANEEKKGRQKRKLLGVLVITDIFEGLQFQGIFELPVVKVVIHQHGSKEFEIVSIEGANTEIITNLAELAALEKARNTPEDLWTYELVD